MLLLQKQYDRSKLKVTPTRRPLFFRRRPEHRTNKEELKVTKPTEHRNETITIKPNYVNHDLTHNDVRKRKTIKTNEEKRNLDNSSTVKPIGIDDEALTLLNQFNTAPLPSARPAFKKRISTTMPPFIEERDPIVRDIVPSQQRREPVTILIDQSALLGGVLVSASGAIRCLDMGNFPHPTSCRRFISCARMENGEVLGWEYTCPKGLSFDPIGGLCNWAAGLECRT